MDNAMGGFQLCAAGTAVRIGFMDGKEGHVFLNLPFFKIKDNGFDKSISPCLAFAAAFVFSFKIGMSAQIPSEPKKKVLYTAELSAAQAEKLREWLSARAGQWEPFEVAYAQFAYKGDKVNVVCYHNGKTVIQGKRTEEFIKDVLEPQITGEALLGYDEVHHPQWFETHAGMDESGKGDLFGPVVCACVVASREGVRQWIDAGVRDSKAISSDAAVLKLEKLIRETPDTAVRVFRFQMPKYNELYRQFGSNLNKLLAWMHARTLESALAQKPAPWGLLDQFSPQPMVQRELKQVPQGFKLHMRPKAESDPVVAAASVIARAEFVRMLESLSEKAGEPLLKGAGSQVKAQAKRLVEKFGPDSLGQFAKLHFRTAYEALGLPVPEKKKWVPPRI